MQCFASVVWHAKTGPTNSALQANPIRRQLTQKSPDGTACSRMATREPLCSRSRCSTSCVQPRCCQSFCSSTRAPKRSGLIQVISALPHCQLDVAHYTLQGNQTWYRPPDVDVDCSDAKKARFLIGSCSLDLSSVSAVIYTNSQKAQGAKPPKLCSNVPHACFVENMWVACIVPCLFCQRASSHSSISVAVSHHVASTVANCFST